jgi:putative transposase
MEALYGQIEALKPQLSVSAACKLFGVAPSSYYAHLKSREEAPERKPVPCRVPGRKLSSEEQEQVINILNSERFQDLAVPQIYSTLLDEGQYYCSISTMYRLLRARNEVKDRRDQRTRVPSHRPELLATAPNQVWSWDISRLKGPSTWRYYYLYMVIDIFSRCVVGWRVERKSSAELADEMLHAAITRANVDRNTLTIHADNGGEMTSITVAELLSDLGVIKSHSRPHTSNDNPYSESQFKTLKYRPQMPRRFASVEEAQDLFRALVDWYNNTHRHSGIGFHTPASLHSGEAAEISAARAAVLTQAYTRNPQRFVNKPPEPPVIPSEVWINPPSTRKEPSRDASEGVGDASAS